MKELEANKIEITENIQPITISEEMESSFIDYAMSVIVSRAIPDAKDGLKPVHRRILFAMSKLEMTHSKPFKKSARVVGEVIAKYHPHGDSSVYEAMVRLAQPFSMRYPLVWGQGNFGSIDGDSAAAMRYTEARMQKISQLLLDDIKRNTVDFQENYDGSEVEPIVLPSKIPNLLMNGSTGIAVGMATSIPPHNIIEILNAAKALSKNPTLDNVDLMEYVKGPDFPTKGIIVNKNQIPTAYKTGRGRVVIRSRTEIDFDEQKSQGTIYVTEIPYMVNKSNLILKIADLVKNKQIESIADIRDESNRKGIRIVIKLKKGFIPQVELNKLFKLSQLQTSFPINMLALVNKRPITLDLKTAIQVYIDHQIDILIRKTKNQLIKAEERKHILEGLSIALNHIDEIIELVKKSNDNKEATVSLMEKYNLSEKQALAILDMKIQRLTGLERNNLQTEVDKLSFDITKYKELLDSREIQIENINEMFDEVIAQYGDERKTELSEETLGEIEDEDLIPREDVIITLTNSGYVKRIPIEEYRVQNRGGTGSKGASTNEDDYVQDLLITNTHTDLMFFSDKGKVYRIRAHQIPQLGKQAKGLPAINLIQIEKNEKIKSLISISTYNNSELFFVTKNGIVKKTDAIQFERVNKNGKIAINLKDQDELLGVFQIPKISDTEIMLANSNGKAIKFLASDVRSMGRTASGVRGMNIDQGHIVDYASSVSGNLIFSISENGFGKITSIEDYRLTKRGAKGVKTINTSLAGSLVGLRSVDGKEDVMITTQKGTVIRTSLTQLSAKGRNTKGVKIVGTREGEIITSIEVIKSTSQINSDIEKTQEFNVETINEKINSQSPEQEKIIEKEIQNLTSEFNVDLDEEK